MHWNIFHPKHPLIFLLKRKIKPMLFIKHIIYHYTHCKCLEPLQINVYILLWWHGKRLQWLYFMIQTWQIFKKSQISNIILIISINIVFHTLFWYSLYIFTEGLYICQLEDKAAWRAHWVLCRLIVRGKKYCWCWVLLCYDFIY